MKQEALNREPETWNMKQSSGNKRENDTASSKHDANNGKQAPISSQQGAFGAAPVRRRKRNYIKKILNDPLIMNA